MNRIRVLVIEDSDVVRQLLVHIISGDARLEVAGAAASAEEGLRLLERLSPDVVSLDIRLPGMNGFEATRRIMADKPTPIVVVSASVESEDLKVTLNALRAGALTVVEKPAGVSHREYRQMAEHLCNQLAIMSQVKVVRQRGNGAARGRPRQTVEGPETMPPTTENEAIRAVGITCSTGGPGALAQILEDFPADFPVPVLLVQHIAPQFLAGFAAWLRSICRLQVVMVEAREPARAGHLYLASGEAHLAAGAGCVEARRGDPVAGQRPSGTLLFRSMAVSLGSRSLGVLLTGMGEDGAEGLLELRRAGGYTIAEAESTAVVYGMPGAAVRLGAARESLPVERIGPRIQSLVRSGRGAFDE